MTDLEARLTQAFEARAQRAPVTSVSPEVMRYAIRRHRMRTAKLCAASLVAVVLLATGVAASTAHTSRRTTPASRVPPTHAWNPGVVLGSMPWTDGYDLSLRYGEGGSVPGFDFCITNANPSYTCNESGPPASSDIGDLGDQGGIYGTAPAAATKVLITIEGGKPVAAHLAPLRFTQPGVPAVVAPDRLMFGAPGVSARTGTKGGLTYMVQIVAYDARGAVVGRATSLGSLDLAAGHPAAPGAVATVVGRAPREPGGLAWISDDGWSCLGQRGLVGKIQRLGAMFCDPPPSGDPVRILSTRASNGLDVYVLRLPATATAATVTRTGSAASVTLTRPPYGVLGVVTLDGTVHTDPFVLIVRDRAGKVIYRKELVKLVHPDADTSVFPG